MPDEADRYGVPWPDIFAPHFEPTWPISMESWQEQMLGKILGRLLDDEPEPGAPYVHTIRQPGPVQDEYGEWYTPIEPTHTIEPRRDGFDLGAIIWDEVTEFAAETMIYGEPLAVTRRTVEAIVAAASAEATPEPLTIRWAERARDAVTPSTPSRALRRVRRGKEEG